MVRWVRCCSLVVLISLGCGSSSQGDGTKRGGRGAGGNAGGTTVGGSAGASGGSTPAGGAGGGSGGRGASGSSSGDGGTGNTGGTNHTGGSGGESGDAGGSDTGSGGAGAGGDGGSSGVAGSGNSAGSGGSGGLGPCGMSPCADTTVIGLRAGGGTACAQFYGGRIKCWGYNLYGQLGYGNTENVGDDELPSGVGYVSLSEDPSVVAEDLSVGLTHACARLSDASVRCWGRGIFGELGYGNEEDVGDDELPSDIDPVSVTTTPGLEVVQLSAGGSHTCALLSDGTIKCWGDNDYRQLGYEDTADVGDDELPSDRPSVSVSTTPGVTVTAISAGLKHTCALLSDASVKCWGANYAGQLARGTAHNMPDDQLPSEVEPIAVTNEAGVTVTAVRAGDRRTCVLLSNGSVKCWGEAPAELVGTGQTGAVIDPSSVGPIRVSDDPSLVVSSVGVGSSHDCVRLSNGTVVCWGASQYGALGYGDIESVGDDEHPASVGPVSATTDAGVTVTELGVGSDFTCVLLSDHSVKCWGDNRLGALGNGKDDGYAVGDDELPSTVGAVDLL